MSTIAESAISSGELGTLWMTYLVKSLMSVFLKRFASTAEDKKAKRIIDTFLISNNKLLEEIKDIFNKEKAVIPEAFGDKDVFNDAPPLFDGIFDMMFLRVIMKIFLGFNAVHLSMSYREDIRKFFENAMKHSNATYIMSTDYLRDQGVLSKPPYVSIPKEIEFIEEKKYMSGIQLFGNKRALNTLETSYIFFILENNIMGMQLMTGFAQVAKEKEIKQYFIKGKELAKKIISDMSSLFLQSDIQPPSTWAGKATDSVVPPFTDKIMMYCANIMCSAAMGANALGMAFSMRSDLPLKLALIAKDTMDFASEGGKLMIKHKWLEEPPQMEDRNLLTAVK